MSLQQKVAVVTGASSGIGEAIARQLSHTGYRLVLTARREERLVALVNSLPEPACYLTAAIEDADTPQQLIDLALSEFGQVDVLINNAGMLVTGSIDEINLDQLALMTRVNFDSVVRASYLFARHFKAQSSGAIINISSVGAYLSHSSMSVYGGLKQALETFTTALRVELKGSGVRVSSIAPGTTDTEIFNEIKAEGRPVATDFTPALQASDIADAVSYTLEQPERANVAKILLVSSSESA